MLRKNLYGLLLVPVLFFASCAKPPVKSTGDKELVIYPSPPAIPRLQFLQSFSSSKEFCDRPSPFHTFIFGEEEDRPIVKPYGIHIEGSKIYICDTGIGGLEILDLEDQSFEYFVPGGLGKLLFPISCCLDEQGCLYIADGQRKQVLIFDEQRAFKSALSMQDEGKPTDVQVDQSFIWVSVIDGHGIQKYDRSSLEYLGLVPEEGAGTREMLYQPVNLSLTDSLLLVSDIGGCKVSMYTRNGKYTGSFGSPGKGFGQFTRPKGIDHDKEGNIYVVDAAFENVQVFNKEGNLLTYFGGASRTAGGLWLPADVAIDYDNKEYFEEFVAPGFTLKYLVFVTNQYGPARVNVYGFIGP